MSYRIAYLSQYHDLETFKGKIIKVLDQQKWTDSHESYWTVVCLVEEKDEKI